MRALHTVKKIIIHIYHVPRLDPILIIFSERDTKNLEKAHFTVQKLLSKPSIRTQRITSHMVLPLLMMHICPHGRVGRGRFCSVM